MLFLGWFQNRVDQRRRWHKFQNVEAESQPYALKAIAVTFRDGCCPSGSHTLVPTLPRSVSSSILSGRGISLPYPLPPAPWWFLLGSGMCLGSDSPADLRAAGGLATRVGTSPCQSPLHPKHSQGFCSPDHTDGGRRVCYLVSCIPPKSNPSAEIWGIHGLLCKCDKTYGSLP